jgi:hypothetical protein
MTAEGQGLRAEGRSTPVLGSGRSDFTLWFFTMQETRDICDTVFENGAAVLMARIVDSAGTCVRRSQVAAIGYSIYELDRRDPDKLSVVPGHDHVPLDVDDVFLDTLESNGLWNVDVAGYNFRHEIYATEDESFPKPGARYEIRYMFIPKFGEPMFVRFHVRVIRK